MMTRLDIGSPAVALAALAEFALLAADQSTHESSVMANFVDGNVHDLVLATTPLEVREDVFAHLVSDPIPEAASLLLCVASAMCLSGTKHKTTRMITFGASRPCSPRSRSRCPSWRLR
jgi:hypothetical protein